MSKTTIQLTEDTKAQLDQHKITDRESYDSVVARLASDHDPDRLDSERVRELIREEVSELVIMEAQK